MKDIEIFLKGNLGEEIIYEQGQREISGELTKYEVLKNKLIIFLENLKITIDNIVEKFTFKTDDYELSISNDVGIHTIQVI
ncbi:MAG: hypothetical protein ACRC1T_05685 [Clostridium chrysemydis]|uniref:hypothetical protein n=1 Tax=Clostridium chrysemydis TaxID=2665504 RepID=UPI003F3FF5E2